MSDAAGGDTGGGILVLIVEDEYFIGEELRRTLTAAGFRVLGPAPSNEEALDLLEQELPQIAVLDVHLRGKRVSPIAAQLQQLNVPFWSCPLKTGQDQVSV